VTLGKGEKTPAAGVLNIDVKGSDLLVLQVSRRILERKNGAAFSVL
jgi:hypothetical protein